MRPETREFGAENTLELSNEWMEQMRNHLDAGVANAAQKLAIAQEVVGGATTATLLGAGIDTGKPELVAMAVAAAAATAGTEWLRRRLGKHEQGFRAAAGEN